VRKNSEISIKKPISKKKEQKFYTPELFRRELWVAFQQYLVIDVNVLGDESQLSSKPLDLKLKGTSTLFGEE
jgi:hypothetical protein